MSEGISGIIRTAGNYWAEKITGRQQNLSAAEAAAVTVGVGLALPIIAPFTISGCATEGADKAKLGPNNLNGLKSGISPTPEKVARADLERGVDVAWTFRSVKNPDDSYKGQKVVTHFDGGDKTFEVSQEGLFSVVNKFTAPLNQAIMADFVYPNSVGEEVIKSDLILLYPFAVTDPAPVYNSPNPAIRGKLSVYPNSDVTVGDTVTAFIPLANVEDSAGRTGADSQSALKVSFLVNNELYEAQIDSGNYTYALTATEPGGLRFQLKAEDPSRFDAVPQWSEPESVYVKSAGTVEETAGPIPDPGQPIMSPFAAKIINGDNRTFTWTYNNLTDENGGPLTIVSDNVDEILYSDQSSVPVPALNYTGAVLTVTGQILPYATGTMRIKVSDDYDHERTLTIYPPIIDQPELDSHSSYIKVGEESVFQLVAEVPGAANYRFYVTDPDGLDSAYLDRTFNAFEYTPVIAGSHTAHLEITAYNGDVIPATFSFMVHEQ